MKLVIIILHKSIKTAKLNNNIGCIEIYFCLYKYIFNIYVLIINTLLVFFKIYVYYVDIRTEEVYRTFF